MKKIIVIGSCNTDMVVRTSRLPMPGETVIGGTFLMNAGGKGANQAIAAARSGVSTTFVTKVGNDMFGKQSFALFEKEGINVDYISFDEKEASGVALITVDEHAENCIVVAPGANGNLNQEDIARAKEEIESSEYLLMQLEIPMKSVEYAADIAYKAGVKVILNPAPAQVISSELLRKLYLITPNQVEAELLTGIKIVDLPSAVEAAKLIVARGARNVIITLGSKGSLICQGGELEMVSAFKVKAVDTTAAGDTYNGALCAALAKGLSLQEAAVYASKGAAISVTRMGAQSSIPTKDEIVNFD